jgi:hypothetical protein
VAIEREESDDLPPEADAISVAISQVIGCIFESLPADCPERRAALCTVIEAHTRIAALLHQPRLN